MPAINLEQAYEEYCIDLVRISDLSQKSVKTYRSVFNTFAERIRERYGREPMTSDLTNDNVHDYFANHVGVTAAKSFALYRSTMRASIAWMMTKGYLEWGPNPVDSLRKRRKSGATTRTRRLSDSEFEQLLIAANKGHNRDLFLCLFMRLSARRIGEVQRMVWGDVLWDEGDVMYDNTKARRDGRKMVLTPELRAVLAEWKKVYEAEVGYVIKSSWYLFPALSATDVARKGRRRRMALSPEYPITDASRVGRDLLKAAGLYLEKGDNWHILRKTAGNGVKQKATAAGRSDALAMAKASLDHADERTTRIYIDEDEDYVRFKEWMMSTPMLSDELARKIPCLAPLVAQRQAEIRAAQEPNEPLAPNVVAFPAARRATLSVVR